MDTKAIIKKDSQKLEDPIMTGAMTAEGIIAQQKLVKDVMSRVMVKGTHYGIIPGCEKPSLWKPGAEVLCVTFRLAPSFEAEEIFDGRHLTIRSRCTLTHIPSGRVFGSGQAICSTKEKKYRLRKDGGKIVENANIEDMYNTVVKMADKRSLVAAVLVTTAASDVFTQDIGDMEKQEDKEPSVIVDAEATVKETPKEDGQAWQGKITKVIPEELPGGRPCWTLIGFDGLEFKTLDESHSKVNGGEYLIRYERNKKGSLVIKRISEVAA